MIPVKKIIVLFIVFSILLAMIPGILPQLQMAIFHDRVIIPQAITKVILVLSLILLMFFTGFKLNDYKIILVWILFFVYLCIHSLIISDTTRFPISSLLFSYNAYYFYLLIIPIYFFVEKTISEKKNIILLMWLFIPLSILGICQFLLNNPILPTESVDNKFMVFAGDFYGNVRAFSLFSSGLEFGNFVNIVTSIAFSYFLNKKGFNKFIWLLPILIGFFASYSTLTRNIYLGTMYSCFSVMVICSAIKRRRYTFAKILPIIFGAFSYYIAVYSLSLAELISGKHDVMKTLSMEMRFNEWSYYTDHWLHQDLLTAFFGTGIIQNQRFEQFSSILIDNNFLAIGYHIGVIGLALWLILMWLMWKFMLKKTVENPTPLSIGLTGFFSTWIALGIFNVTIFIYPLVFILFMMNGKTKQSNSLILASV